MIGIACAVILIVQSLWNRHRYLTHRACEKGCNSKHPRVVAGSEGETVAAAYLLVVMLVERAL